MAFREITKEQHDLFVSALAAGQYNLLLGAGFSADSTNTHGRLPIGDALKDELCDLTGANKKYSLQRVFSLLNPIQIREYVTDRFSNCQPGPTAKIASNYVWKRIFTWNIDDVLQNQYCNFGRQELVTIHYADEFVEVETSAEVMLIHLHGTVLVPEKGYVFSREAYVQQIRSINPWMSVLTNFLQSEPFIISGTQLDEIDLDFYLSHRTPITSRTDRGPSILVAREEDAVTRKLCDDHNLIQFVGWSNEFFQYCQTVLPNPPAPEDLIPGEFASLLPQSLSRSARLSFQSDFELVPGVAKPAKLSRFPYGHEASWNDLAAKLDVPRGLTSGILTQIEKSASSQAGPAEIFVLLDSTGTGKTTVLRRISYLLAERGMKVLYCSVLSRLTHATTSVIDLIDGPLLIVIDNLADQATAVAEVVGQLEKRDVVFLGSERSYRERYIRNVLSGTEMKIVRGLGLTDVEAEQLIDRYADLGAIGDYGMLKSKAASVKSLAKDPIAVACCRILKDFRPLSRIILDLQRDSTRENLDRYICSALAQHCVRSGVRYDILAKAVSPNGIADQFNGSQPLPLAYSDSGSSYVVPENSTIGAAILDIFAEQERERLLEIYIGLAIELQPFVNRQTIKRRMPEARLSGRLFDYDDVVSRFLGDLADDFYERTREYWKWNSRYWEQVALLQLAHFNSQRNEQGFLDAAVQHARHAVAIEFHPFPLTTLGKVLFVQMAVNPDGNASLFNEAFECLNQAIEREARWARRAVQPFATLFSGVLQYVDIGGSLSSTQLDAIRSLVKTAQQKFPREAEVISSIDSLKFRRIV